MASVTVSSRICHGKSEKILLNFVNLKGKVFTLKEEVSKTVNFPSEDIELVYCGQCLHNDKELEAYGVKTGATLFALRKHHAIQETKPEPMTDVAVRQVVTSLQSALVNPAYRTTVEKMLNSPDAMENLIASTPGLDKDPIAVAMLQDQELLSILAHPGNIRKVLQEHPSFARAALVVSAAVSEERAREEGARVTTGSYSLDQLSDDEDDSAMRQGPPGGVTGGRQGITATQLSAALAAAAGTSSGSSYDPGPSNRSPVGPPLITSDFFQHAIQQAQDAAVQAQVSQLRDMGITDEALARRALQATGGDIQAAVDLIFGDQNF